MVFNLFHSFTLPLIFALSAAAFNNTVYLISNAETPSLGLPGLTPIGFQRANDCLPSLLAPLDIGLIVTCPFDPASGLCSETITTATPIGNALGLSLNTSCGADEETDDDCVHGLLRDFSLTSTQAMLVVWDLSDFDSLFENLDIDDDFLGGDDDEEDDEVPHFDLLTTVVKNKVTAQVSQGCSGIDGQAPGTFRRSLRRHNHNVKKRQVPARMIRRRRFA